MIQEGSEGQYNIFMMFLKNMTNRHQDWKKLGRVGEHI